MTKYLFSDLDGTLMLEKDMTIPGLIIPTHNLKKINEFTKKGNFFGIATGRPYGNVLEIIKTNNLSDLSVCENGMIVSSNNEIILSGTLNLQELQIVIDYIKVNNLQCLGFYKSTLKAFYNEKMILEATKTRILKYENTYKFVELSNVNLDEVIHLTLLFESFEQKMQHLDILNGKLSKTKVIATMHDGADFVNIETSKLNAILEFCKLKGIEHGQIGYVGDGLNDFECLDYFENSFVMKNSTPELLAQLKNKYKLVEDVAEAISIFTGE